MSQHAETVAAIEGEPGSPSHPRGSVTAGKQSLPLGQAHRPAYLDHATVSRWRWFADAQHYRSGRRGAGVGVGGAHEEEIDRTRCLMRAGREALAASTV